LRIIPVNTEEFAHTAHIPRGESANIRILHLYILRSGDRRAFLGSSADNFADHAVLLHLRQVRRHDLIQIIEHAGIVDFLSDVHWFSFPAFPPSIKALYYNV